MAPIQHAMMQITNDLREDLRQLEVFLDLVDRGGSATVDGSVTQMTALRQIHRTMRTKINLLATILATESDDILKDVRREEDCLPGGD